MDKDFAVFNKLALIGLKFKLYGFCLEDAQRIFECIEKNKDKYYSLVYVEYEFYKYFSGFKSKTPLIYAALYEKSLPFKTLASSRLAYIPQFIQKLDKKAYYEAFDKVKEALAKGQSYEVNLTQELRFKTKLSPTLLFSLLCARQDTKFKAYLKNDYLEVLSFSPELFFKTKEKARQIKIITKPMKGTAPRAKNPKKDKANAKFLQNDSKSLSENVMIVDLLRNDLARICKPNSIDASKLFYVQSYPTLHQMSSKISGILEEHTSFLDIFKALFPCGSITGAPKDETMKLIKELEMRHRGLYCGSIGLIHKNKSVFSVAIRTLFKRQNEDFYSYGVGSGLVWDSKKKQEFKELKLKTKFLKSNVKDFYLFETMLLKKDRVLFLKEHLQRLLNSALSLGFKNKELKNLMGHYHQERQEKLKNLDLQALNEFLFYQDNTFLDKSFITSREDKALLRLKLFKNGKLESEILPFRANLSNTLFMSEHCLIKNDLSFHKSSLRKPFEDSAKLYNQGLCYDELFCDDEGRLLEGSRSNLLLELDEGFFTPSLENGLLNGIYRSFLLKHKFIKEKNLFKADLLRAKKIFMLNSVRGAVEVSFKEKS